MNITELPTFENMKSFMVFDGDPSADNFLFDGNFEHFADTFFANPTWEVIEAWADEQGFTLALEGSDVYKEMTSIFANEELRLVGDEFYNADGSYSRDGMFDAGGHLVDTEKYFEYADSVRDRIRDEG